MTDKKGNMPKNPDEERLNAALNEPLNEIEADILNDGPIDNPEEVRERVKRLNDYQANLKGGKKG